MRENGKFKEIERLLGPLGPLAEAWPDYEVRPGQIRMAQAVARAIDQGQIAVIEAGTGIGKTLAYLLPALMSGKKTLVSTGLKNLQDQIHKKDLAFIERYFGGGFAAALVKGRENYLCLRLYRKTLKKNDLLRISGLKKPLEALAEWLEKTPDGDLGTLPREALPVASRHGLSCPPETCKGSACPLNEDCFLQKNRRQAAAADLVLVNHHLFLADLAIRMDGGKVLPDWDLAVFDEAHFLEGAATSWFGRELRAKDLELLGREAARFFDSLKDPLGSAELSLAFQASLESLPDLLSGRPKEDVLYPPEGSGRARQNGPIKEALSSIASMADALRLRLPRPDENSEDDEAEILRGRLASLSADARMLEDGSDPAYVYQMERRAGGLAISALPIDAGVLLGRKLLESAKPVVMTSATLSAGGDFGFMRRRLGLEEEDDNVSTLSIESPYDYRNNTVLYIPDPFPGTNHPNFQAKAEEEILKLLNITKGRALVLFTSHRALSQTAKSFRRLELPYRLLVQEEGADKAGLLNQFARDQTSVLLGTSSFWQGVDVPGPSLSAVIIDKLPFPRPNAPLTMARSQRIEEAGGNAFRELSLPQMAITLRQGLGRLLRTSADRGLLAILDNRLAGGGKSYRFEVLAMIPPSPLTSDIRDVAKFMRSV
ncbi:MAG: ATP-dependent DNA helicase [Deltaproteobacteria bacterium]|jgi:ATP-dependent DNA helicase DinG|nr:ATP-dependent DNA helicase [Deltaproteobacteria bacterium]